MASFNQVNLMGRITRDPEVKSTKSGKKVVTFSIAVDKYGSDDANFFRVETWGKTADAVEKFGAKGNPILVSGYLDQRVWESSGERHQQIVVVGRNIEFIQYKKKDNGQQAEEDYSRPISIEDIPF